MKSLKKLIKKLATSDTEVEDYIDKNPEITDAELWEKYAPEDFINNPNRMFLDATSIPAKILYNVPNYEDTSVVAYLLSKTKEMETAEKLAVEFHNKFCKLFNTNENDVGNFKYKLSYNSDIVMDSFVGGNYYDTLESKFQVFQVSVESDILEYFNEPELNDRIIEYIGNNFVAFATIAIFDNIFDCDDYKDVVNTIINAVNDLIDETISNKGIIKFRDNARGVFEILLEINKLGFQYTSNNVFYFNPKNK